MSDMTTTRASPENPIRVQNPESLEGGLAETRLKRHLGRGIYVQDYHELSNGNLEITLGNANPRDLSDCRDRDNVLKFITLRDVYTLIAERGEGGIYEIDVPPRSAVIEGIEDREDNIKDKLDFSMAQAIYGRVYDLPVVRTQLNPILQILRATRNRSKVRVAEIERDQRTNKTQEYINLLENFGYIEVEEGIIAPGERLRSADLNEYDWDEFGRKFLGDVVQRGYVTMREEMRLSMLGHYQKYSGSYYYDAIQKGDKDLWLDIKTIGENLKELHGERRGDVYLHDKLGELASVDVIEKDGDYVRSEEDIYNQVAKHTPVA